MKVSFTGKLIMAAASAMVCASVSAADITGAGATFPYPIYAKWAESYKSVTGTKLNYQAIGSGGGIKQIKAKTVDFGASDMPLTASELQEAGLVQFPAILGGVVPIVNLPGVKAGQLKMSGDVLADIYLGKITKWNDGKITSMNPGVSLPGSAITVVHRADGSGTSFLWTDYLSKVSPDFKSRVGSGTAVKWPTGVGGKGNEGVAANVQRIKGSIGYVEYAYAKKNNIAYTQLKGKNGKFITPNDASFKQAAAKAPWSKTPGYGVILTNQSGWPITGASFILMQKVQADPAKGAEVLKFFNWSFKNGGKMASELDYVALPAPVVKMIEKSWKTGLKGANGQAVWK